MMTMKKWISMALVLCILVVLTACGSSGTKVYVQSVSSLMNLGGIAPGSFQSLSTENLGTGF